MSKSIKKLLAIAGIVVGWFMLGYGFAATNIPHPINTSIFLGGFVVLILSLIYLVLSKK